MGSHYGLGEEYEIPPAAFADPNNPLESEVQKWFGNSSDELDGDDSFIRYAPLADVNLSQTIKATKGAYVLHNNEGGAYAEWNRGGWFNDEQYTINITSVLQNINSANAGAATGWGNNTYFHIVVDFVLTDGTKSTTGTKHYQVRVNSGTFTVDNVTSVSAMSIAGSTAGCVISTTGSDLNIVLASTAKFAGVYFSVTLKVTSVSFTLA